MQDQLKNWDETAAASPEDGLKLEGTGVSGHSCSTLPLGSACPWQLAQAPAAR